MRLFLLGLIFLLILTLGNAFLLKRDRQTMGEHDYATMQTGQRRAGAYGWDAFVWREVAAIAITIVVFGAIASTGTRRA